MNMLMLGAAFLVAGSGSVDVSSGYVLYGSRSNDEPCLWTYGELTAGHETFGSLGVSLWQNTDLTSRRSKTMRRMNEWDWYAFYRGGIDLADAGRLQLEAGHIWYKFHGVRAAYRSAYATMEEWAGRLTLENPFVTPYLEYHYDHKVTKGTFILGGLRRTFDFAEGFYFTPDLTIGGGDRNYNECLYPPYDGSIASGLSFAQLTGTIGYWFNAHFGVHARVSYVTLLNDDIDQTDFVWGTVGVDVAF